MNSSLLEFGTIHYKCKGFRYLVSKLSYIECGETAQAFRLAWLYTGGIRSVIFATDHNYITALTLKPANGN